MQAINMEILQLSMKEGQVGLYFMRSSVIGGLLQLSGRMYGRLNGDGFRGMHEIDQAVLCLKLSGIGQRYAGDEADCTRTQLEQSNLPQPSPQSSLNSSFAKGSNRSQKKLNSSVRRPATDRILPLSALPPSNPFISPIRPPPKIRMSITRTISLCYCSPVPMARQPSELSNFFTKRRKAPSMEWADEVRGSVVNLNPLFERIVNILPKLGNVETVKKSNQRLMRTNDQLLRESQAMGVKIDELELKIDSLQQTVSTNLQTTSQLKEDITTLETQRKIREEHTAKMTYIMQQYLRQNNDLKEKMKHLKKEILRMRHSIGETHLIQNETDRMIGIDSF